MSVEDSGNLSSLSQNAALYLVGSSRVVEEFYTSSPLGLYLGNLSASELTQLALNVGSRVVEIDYSSQAS